MDKNYSLDTNIILHNPYILNQLNDCTVFISIAVLEELDKYKSDPSLGMASRHFTNQLDLLHETNNLTENNVKIVYDNIDPDIDINYLGKYSNDNIIIDTAKRNNAILLSGDTNVRVKARNFAMIEAVNAMSDFSEDIPDNDYKGYIEYYLSDDLLNSLYKLKYLSIDYIKEIKIYPHMFIILKRFSGKSGDLIAKVNSECTCIELINQIGSIWGINALNVEQTMLFHLLLDDDIPLVTVEGKAGTGKTLLALAAGLMLTQDKKDSLYRKLTLTKPTIDMGKELGALPGDKDEKLAPYMASYFDALEFIFNGPDEMDNAMTGIINMEMDSLNYLRGRSLPKQFFIGDEMQNTNNHEIKSTVTRMGKDSKIILMGDPKQIDNPRLGPLNNGLVHVKSKFMNQPLGAHITLTHGVRSPLADIAADIL